MFLPECPFIVKLEEIYEEKNEIILVMELMEGDNLYKTIKSTVKLSEQQIYKIFSQILKGLLFLHLNGIMHRDIKPDNIMYSNRDNNSHLKILDFSLANEYLPGQNFKDSCGTPGFMAPEILNEKIHAEEVDVFSLGVVLYML